jgi:hypothetical protein
MMIIIQLACDTKYLSSPLLEEVKFSFFSFIDGKSLYNISSKINELKNRMWQGSNTNFLMRYSCFKSVSHVFR